MGTSSDPAPTAVALGAPPPALAPWENPMTSTIDPTSSRGRLAGVIPPIVTPLTDDRGLDEPSLERLLERLIAAGVDGIFTLGTTGEGVFCTASMRRQVITTVVRSVGGRVPVLAGVIDTQTDRVLEHIAVAADLGVDGVVATAPFYAFAPPAQVGRHFEILGERSTVPVYAYDMPLSVHTKLDPDMLVRLGRTGAIAGVKDTSGDDASFRRLALLNEDAGRPLTLLTGHEAVVDGAYLSGADGVVPGLGNLDPAGFVRMHAAAQAGDWQALRDEQNRLVRLREIFRVPRDAGWGAAVGAVKTALQILGVIDSSQLPAPFEALTGTDVDRIREILAGVGPDA